jgi:hypothetical protein
VADRLEDIESTVKQPLQLDAVKVGTLADEHWWHKNWESLRISGEWFYLPRSNNRELPPFLAASALEAA